MAQTPFGGGNFLSNLGANQSQFGGGGQGDPVGNAFGNIYSMFGPQQSGQAGVGSFNLLGSNLTGQYGKGPGGTSIGPGGTTMQNLGTADNPLTAAWLSGANYLGSLGPTLTQGGMNLMGQGFPIAQTGLGMAGTGFGTTQQALATMAPSIDYYSALAGGNPQAVAQALAPQSANIGAIYANAENQAAMGMPQGGLRRQTVPGLQGSMATTEAQQAAQAQQGAYGQLAALGPAISGIGTQQAGIGQGIAGTGLNISQLGQQLASMGIQVSETQLADILQKMNINYQAPNWQQSLLAVTGAIGNLVGSGATQRGSYG